MQGGPGMPDADFVLYVTATTFPACSTGTIATAGFCTLDLDTSRPLAGFANFCPTMLQPDRNWGYQLDTAVHEILHSRQMHPLRPIPTAR